MPTANHREVSNRLERPTPPKATLVRRGADFWRVFNLNPLTKEKPDG